MNSENKQEIEKLKFRIAALEGALKRLHKEYYAEYPNDEVVDAFVREVLSGGSHE